MTTTSVSHENDIIQDYVHAQLTAACKEGSLTLETIIEKPVLDCYNHEKLLDLMALPTLDIASIKEAFMPPCTMPNRAAIIDRIIAAGFDPLPDIQSISNVVAMTTTSTTTTATVRTTPVTLSGIPPIDGRTRLDPRFKVGFSELHGHAVEIDRKSNDSNRLEAHGRRRVESGTYIFEHDEMPYASVIEKVWKDRLCEECLRRLPKDSEVVACPSCPKVRSNASSAEITFNRSSLSSSTSQGRFTDQKIPQSDGVARFCSQSCLQSAWRAWHGYECGYSAQLMGHSQLTRLALRILWQNVRHGIFITASLLDLLTPAPTTSDPAFSLINTVADLSLDTDGSSLDMSNNSLCYSPRSINTNGSDILPSQLCHNFGRLNRVTKLAFLMTGYYLQWLIDLPEDLAVELAYLQALVKFNSFAIKAHFLTSMDRSKNITERNEYTIGSALYPLASMFNHSCTPNAMVVFGKDGKLLQDKSVGGGLKDDFKEPDPRLINVITSKALRVDSDLPVFIKISYGPQAGRMSTKERKEYLRQSYLFECDCSACDDQDAESDLKKVYLCQKNRYECQPMTETDKRCPTCSSPIDIKKRQKMLQAIKRLLTETQDPSLIPSKRLALLETLESVQSEMFVDTYILYGNTCDQLAMMYAQKGDLDKSIGWCKKALKAVVVHFAHNSIEVAQETLKLAGLLFNNMQVKEAMKQVQIAITLYRDHYGVNSRHPDLLELYEMEKILKPLV